MGKEGKKGKEKRQTKFLNERKEGAAEARSDKGIIRQEGREERVKKGEKARRTEEGKDQGNRCRKKEKGRRGAKRRDEGSRTRRKIGRKKGRSERPNELKRVKRKKTSA